MTEVSVDRALVALFVLFYAAPVVLSGVLFWKRELWTCGISDWRRRMWRIGLILAIVTSLVVPLFLLGIQFLSAAAKQSWFIDWSQKTMLLAWLLALLSAVLLGFGRGNQRWLGILTAGLTFVNLFVSLIGMSA